MGSAVADADGAEPARVDRCGSCRGSGSGCGAVGEGVRRRRGASGEAAEVADRHPVLRRAHRAAMGNGSPTQSNPEKTRQWLDTIVESTATSRSRLRQQLRLAQPGAVARGGRGARRLLLGRPQRRQLSSAAARRHGDPGLTPIRPRHRAESDARPRRREIGNGAPARSASPAGTNFVAMAPSQPDEPAGGGRSRATRRRRGRDRGRRYYHHPHQNEWRRYGRRDPGTPTTRACRSGSTGRLMEVMLQTSTRSSGSCRWTSRGRATTSR